MIRRCGGMRVLQRRREGIREVAQGFTLEACWKDIVSMCMITSRSGRLIDGRRDDNVNYSMYKCLLSNSRGGRRE